MFTIKERSLASIRYDLHLNQSQMAKALNISHSAYSKKEQGRLPLLARELKRIYELSGVPMEEIEILN